MIFWTQLTTELFVLNNQITQECKVSFHRGAVMTFIKYDPDDDYEYGSDLSDLVEYLQRVAIDAYVVSKYGDGANRVSMTDQSY